jgi:T5orf172 domain
MIEYRYKDLPLTPAIASELVIQFLETQLRPSKRVDIARYVIGKHSELGGISVPNSEDRIKKALATLVEDKLVQSPINGYYKVSALDSLAVPLVIDDQNLIVQESSEDILVSERILGSGPEIVYVYFQEAERKLAVFENKTSWPCKVGYTAGTLTNRILSQGIATSMSRLPIVGLEIRTEDGRDLERVLHFALNFAGCWIPDSVGTEWFETSPEKIANWYTQFCEAMKQLS